MTSPLSHAADSGWFGGLNIGQSMAKIDNVKITDQLFASGLSTTSIVDDDRNTAYKLFAGYKFNQYFALEGGGFDLGKFGYTANTLPTGTLNGSIRLRGMNIDAVGILPLSENFSAFGRAGGSYAEARDTFTSTGAVGVPTIQNPSQNAYNFKAGLGVQYDFSESIGLRGEWERYRINDAVGSRGDIDMLSLGVVVMLGGDKPAPLVAVTPPPPEPVVAEEMAPPPVMVIVPVIIKTQKYCSILDIQFEIKQGDIQREEKEKLNVLGTFMKKYPNTTAVIEGHTDDVGTEEFNLKLSQKRAESVVSYLMDSFHIASNRLTAVGYGESRPIADNKTSA